MDSRQGAVRLAALAGLTRMRLLLLGKIEGIQRWAEDIASDLRIDGHRAVIFPTRDPRLGKQVERALLSPTLGAPLAGLRARQMRRMAPDMVLAVGGFDAMPQVLVQRLAAVPGRPPLVGWIGDIFTKDAAPLANMFDLLVYTDTGMLELHRRFGFRPPCAYVPLGATRALTAPPAARAPILAFVAAASPHRRDVLAGLRAPVALFGPAWQQPASGAPDPLAQHPRVGRRVLPAELATIHAGHLGVLNIRNEQFVLNGLNQRHFAPYLQATPVLSDAQPDIENCFDPASEIIVWRDPDELEACYAALRADPARAAAIGLAGQARVLAHHCYAHRVAAIAALVDAPYRNGSGS